MYDKFGRDITAADMEMYRMSPRETNGSTQGSKREK